MTSLPVGVRGRSSVTMNSRGTLKWAMRSRAYAVSSAARSGDAAPSARRLDERHHPLPHLVVGYADHGDVEHRRVQAEQVLDLLRIDVHAAADDHERLAVGQEQVAVLVDVAEVADRRSSGVLGVPRGRGLLRVAVVGERLARRARSRSCRPRPAEQRCRRGRRSAAMPSSDRADRAGVGEPVLAGRRTSRRWPRCRRSTRARSGRASRSSGCFTSTGHGAAAWTTTCSELSVVRRPHVLGQLEHPHEHRRHHWVSVTR